ncbi:MAG TPA: biotin--[acetyl-CoA-carboxylase] ligase [Methylomirabilota bacterium]|nr:biotin--[acetyl-CoA-carboxylase] ligase [Methylomirabilota bacterium]
MTRALKGRVIGCAVHALDEVDSTQAELVRLAAQGAPEGTVVSAHHQRAGRGRRGRCWWDEPGDSLLFSVLLRPPIETARAPQLSLVGALAVTDALRSVAGVDARIRWPNDVLIEGRKVGGILPEAVSTGDNTIRFVMLGIGLNVNQRRFPDELSGRATSLRLVTGRRHEPEALLDAVLEALDGRYSAWLGVGFTALRDACRERSATLGQSVALSDGGAGTAVDLDADGALLVRTDAGVLRRVVSGEPEEGVPHAAGH